MCFSCAIIAISQEKNTLQKLYKPLELSFPLLCQLNQDCWILTSEEKGTDIAVKTYNESGKATPVLSAQDGTVVLVNKDINNQSFYGNSVVVEHTNGWKTVYSHLKTGSINTEVGKFAGKGKQIAELGMSGKADYPHLHFTVYKNGEFYKPSWDPLSKNDYSAKDLVLAKAGVSMITPDLNSIREGKYDATTVLSDTPTIYLWVYGFKLKKGDFIKFSMKNSNNVSVISSVVEVSADYTETFYTISKPKGEESWSVGNYKAKVELIRASNGIAKECTFSFNVKDPEKPIDPELKKKQEEEKKLEEYRKNKRKQLYIYKKLYKDGKLPDTVPDNVINVLKGS